MNRKVQWNENRMLFLMMQSDWPSVLYILDTTLLKLLLYTFGCSEPFVIICVLHHGGGGVGPVVICCSQRSILRTT